MSARPPRFVLPALARARLPGALLLTLACACAPREPAPEPYVLRDVVGPALAAAEARVAAAPAAPDPKAVQEARDLVEGLIGSLTSSDARMRTLAATDARALDAAGVAAAARILQDDGEDVTRRVAAARALGEVARADAADALIGPFESAHVPAVRAQCAYQLGRVKQDHVLPRMLQRLKYESDGETVIWLAQALSRFGNLAGVDGLHVLATTARDENVRATAANVGAELAGEFGASDLAALRAEWFSGAFEARRPPVVPSPALELEAWRRIARLSVWDLRQVDDARFSLVALDAWVEPLVVSALHDANTYTRLHATQVLERRGRRATHAVDALIDALREPRTAPDAAAALGAIGDPRGEPALARALKEGRDLDLRVAAARALGRSGARASLATLETAFAPGSPPDLRQAAAESLLALDERDSARAHLAAVLAEGTGDPVGAEDALGAHLARRAATDEAARALLERWNALDVRAGDIATVAETEARQRARGRLLSR